MYVHHSYSHLASILLIYWSCLILAWLLILQFPFCYKIKCILMSDMKHILVELKLCSKCRLYCSWLFECILCVADIRIWMLHYSMLSIHTKSKCFVRNARWWDFDWTPWTILGRKCLPLTPWCTTFILQQDLEDGMRRHGAGITNYCTSLIIFSVAPVFFQWALAGSPVMVVSL